MLLGIILNVDCTFSCELVNFVVGEVDVPQVCGVGKHTTRELGNAIVRNINVLQQLPA